MEVRQELNVLISVLARVYEQIFLMEKNAEGGILIAGKDRTVVADYNAWCRETYENSYMGDDLKAFLKKLDKDAVMESLAYEDDYVMEYAVAESGEERRKEMKAFFCEKETWLCVCFSDVTQERLKAETADQFARKCMDIAYECNLARENFFVAMEQELRGPVYSMQGMLEQALSSEGESREGYIGKTKECLDQYSMLLEQFLTLSKMEKGEIEAGDDVILMEKLIERMQNMISGDAERKNISVELENKTPEVVAFESDYGQIRQILYYILDLCVKYGKEGSAIRGEVSLDMREATDEDVEVHDFVCRLQSEGLAFEQLLSEEKRTVGLLHRMTDGLGGLLQMNEAQDGKEVLLRIPVLPADEEEAREKGIVMHLTDSIHERDFSAYRALVVDDDALRREVTAARLERFGLSVDMAADGQEAIDMLVAAPIRYYHIMFISPILPRKTGYETTMELREMSRIDLNDITIVALTTNEVRDDRIKALEHGMDYHIPLPLDDIELKEILIRELQDIGPDDEHEVFGFRVIK